MTTPVPTNHVAEASVSHERHLSTLSDALHRALSLHPPCWLLIDAAARALTQDAPLLSALQAYALTAVPSRHPALDASMLPRLVAIDSSTASGSQALQDVLRVALDELDPVALQAGQGRQISAWLCCEPAGSLDEQAAALQAHLARSVLQTRESRPVLLRWYDPAVLWGLWLLLNDDQKNTLLGPIRALWLLDPLGQWLPLQRSTLNATTTLNPTDLSLSIEQWRDLDHLATLNNALREVALPTGAVAPTRLTAMRAQVMRALRRARSYGINDEKDLALFARFALQVHPRFDQHAQIQARIKQRPADTYFSAVIDDLTCEQWQHLQAECAAMPHMDHLEID